MRYGFLVTTALSISIITYAAQAYAVTCPQTINDGSLSGSVCEIDVPGVNVTTSGSVGGLTSSGNSITGNVNIAGNVNNSTDTGLLLDSSTSTGNIIISSTGTLSGGDNGIYISNSSVGDISNAGQINASSGGGILADGNSTISSITNSGTINANKGIFLTNTVSVTNGITNSGTINTYDMAVSAIIGNHIGGFMNTSSGHIISSNDIAVSFDSVIIDGDIVNKGEINGALYGLSVVDVDGSNGTPPKIIVDGGSVTSPYYGIYIEGNSASDAHELYLNNATVSGSYSAISFDGVNGALFLSGSNNITGNVSVNGGIGTLVLQGSDSQTFDSDNIDTQYNGFNFFAKDGSGDWTLTGNTKKNWSVIDGTLIGTAANIGDVVLYQGPDGSTLKLTGGGNYSGVVDGIGNFQLDGNNTYTLSGTNTFHGNLVISNGATLEASSSAQLGASDSGIALVNNGTLKYTSAFDMSRYVVVDGGGTIDTNGHDVTISGDVFGGGGNLGKQGAGTLVLTGITSVDSSLDVGGGTLEVEDVYHVPGANVSADANLKANGVFDGNVFVNGHFNVGTTANPIGRVVVNGTYWLDDSSGNGSSTDFTVTNHGASQLIINGMAVLGAHTPDDNKIKINIDNAGTYTGNYAYTLIRSSQPFYFVGAEVEVSPPPAAADGHDYVVKINNNFRTSNELIVYLIEQGVIDNPQLFSNVTNISLDNMRRNTNQILNRMTDLHTYNAAYQSAATDPTEPFQVAMAGDAEQLNGLLDTASGNMNKKNAWFKALGSFGSQDNDKGISGYNSRSGGFIGGLDHPIGDNALIGISAGYTISRLNGNNSSGKADLKTPIVALYTSYDTGYASLDATAAYAYSRINTDRTTFDGHADAAHNQNEWSAALQASHAYRSGKLEVVPRIGLQYTKLSSEGFTESGSMASATIRPDSVDSLQPFAGVSFSTKLTDESGMVYVPQIRANYHYEALDTAHNMDFFANGAAGTAVSISEARNTLSMGAGLNTNLSNSLEAYANYDADIYIGKGKGNTISAGLKYSF